MEETKEERIQRLVKEGIEKAKLNDKTSGNCFGGKKEPYRSDKPPTPPTLIGKPSKTWNTGENPPIDELPVEILTKTPFSVLNIIAVVLGITITVFVLTSPTFLSNLNYGLTNYGLSSEARAEIFADANAWGQSCSNAINSYNEDGNINNKLLAQVSCQGYLNYLEINREVLDSGTVKNLASDNILSLEEEIKRLDASTPTSGGTGTSSGTVTSGGTSSEDVFSKWSKCVGADKDAQNDAKREGRPTYKINYAIDVCEDAHQYYEALPLGSYTLSNGYVYDFNKQKKFELTVMSEEMIKYLNEMLNPESLFYDNRWGDPVPAPYTP